MNAIELLAAAQRQIHFEHVMRAFANVADNISRDRPLYWRWTSHLAAAIVIC